MPDRRKDSVPPEKHPPYPWHILARQSVQPRGPVPSQPSKHVHPAQTAQAALARACLPHEGWSHPKRHSLWRIGIWEENQQLRYKDVCKRDMKALDINPESWEDLAADLMRWRRALIQHLKSGEEKLMNAEGTKERNNPNRLETTHKCYFCGKDCLSNISLYSHRRRCNNETDWTTRMYFHDQTRSAEAIYHK